MGEAPTLYMDLAPYWEAFSRLCATRTYGEGGPDPLQPAQVASYLDIYGVGGISERQRYYELITALDSVWLKKARADIAGAIKRAGKK